VEAYIVLFVSYMFMCKCYFCPETFNWPLYCYFLQ